MTRTPIRLPRRLFPALALLCASFAASLLAHSQSTRLWQLAHAEDLEHGSPQGITITSDGKLRFGPAASEILTTPSTFLWAIVEEPDTEAIDIATGSPAYVLRNGKPLFTTHALAVTALALGPDGNLYAATMPDGKIYKLDPKSPKPLDETTAPVVFDLAQFDSSKPDAAKTDSKSAKSRYIWQLTFGPDGHLYAATGAPGAIYRIDIKTAKAAPFFSTDEAHIRSLAWDKSGNLIAGSDGSGLIYRITPEGKGYVLFSAPRREIPALAVAPDGTIYAADLGDKSRNPLPQLPVQNGLGITITFSQPGSVQAANASTTLPEGTEIYALAPNQAPRRIWTGKDEIVYGLAPVPAGILAFTGNRGRILEIHPDGSSADLAHLDAQQITAFQPTQSGWLIGTSNTGRLYTLTSAAKPADTHIYSSDVLDAGSFSRWGRIEVDPASHGYQLFTRSGNIEQPIRNAKDWGWTDWQPLTDGRITSPPGRYLQWKAVLQPQGELSGVAVNYLPVNSAPVVDEILVVPGARVTPPAASSTAPTVSIAFPNPAQATLSFDGATNGALQAQKDKSAITARWAAHDDNGDDLAFDLYLRGDGESIWRPLKKSLTDKFYSFDASTIPDGGYQLKVVASDAPSHTPSDALTGEAISDRFELDTTPPVLSALKATISGSAISAISVTLSAHDATSPIVRAEYSLDAGPWQYIEPVGTLSDSSDERYDFRIPLDSTSKPAEHLITVRVYDRHDNIGSAKAVVPAPPEVK